MGANTKVPAGISYEKGRDRWRVWYWDGGVTGLGKRRFENCTDEEHASRRVQEIVASLDVAPGRVVPADLTFGEVAARYIEEVGPRLEAGTLKAYRRDINCYLFAANLSAVPVRNLTIRHFAKVVDNIDARGLSPATLNGAIRTLNVLLAWGEPRLYFPANAWGTAKEREGVLKPARRRLSAASAPEAIRWEQVPTWADVERFAEELERLYPEHGRNFVLVMAGSGLRFGEAVGLRVENIDIERCAITVEHQADRLAAWPAVTWPKDRQTRTTYMWSFLRHVLEDMVANAGSDGWLFPPDVPQFGTRGLWWVNRLTERAKTAREAAGWDVKGWGNKWCRHHYASYSLANPPWGYGISLSVVADALGHENGNTTLKYYVQKTGDSGAIIAQATMAPPEAPGGSSR